MLLQDTFVNYLIGRAGVWSDPQIRKVLIYQMYESHAYMTQYYTDLLFRMVSSGA